MSKPAFSVKVDMRGLRDLMADFTRECEEAARPAAQAGAQVIYEEVKKNVGQIKKKTGNLASSIYQAYSKDNSAEGRATYHVSWNAKKAPHGHLVEFGHIQRYRVGFNKKTGRFFTVKSQPVAPKLVAARPFIRPAAAKFPEAELAMEARFFSELQKKGLL